MLLYKDLFTIISQHCDTSSLVNLACSCKCFWDAYISGNYKKQLGNFKLRYIQTIIAERVHKGELINLNAPISYGKTAIGYGCIFFDSSPFKPRTGNIWIIIVPTKAVETWKQEAIKIFGKEIFDRKNPYTSPLLILNTKLSPYHNRLILSDTNLTQSNHIILISNNKTKRFILTQNYNLIVDEAHTNSLWHKNVNTKVIKSILLSASLIHDADLEKMLTQMKYKSITVGWTQANNIPSINFFYVDTPEYTYGKVLLKGRYIDQDIYIGKIDYLLSQMKSCRVVIFYPPGDAYENIYSPLNQVCTKYNFSLVVYNTLQSVIKFESCMNQVLLISHTESESININAEACICIRPDYLNLDRINQMVGRVLRSTNPNKIVYVYNITPKGYPKYKTIYANSHYLCNVTLNDKDIEPDHLLTGFRTLYSYDKTLSKITGYDIIAICNSSHSKNSQILSFWLNKPSFFTEEMKKLIFDFYDI